MLESQSLGINARQHVHILCVMIACSSEDGNEAPSSLTWNITHSFTSLLHPSILLRRHPNTTVLGLPLPRDTSTSSLQQPGLCVYQPCRTLHPCESDRAGRSMCDQKPRRVGWTMVAASTHSSMSQHVICASHTLLLVLLRAPINALCYPWPLASSNRLSMAGCKQTTNYPWPLASSSQLRQCQDNHDRPLPNLFPTTFSIQKKMRGVW